MGRAGRACQVYDHVDAHKECLLQCQGDEDYIQLWEKLCGLYEQKSATSQVYWLKQLVDLKMKEGTAMLSHLNDFNTIFSNLSAQDVEFEDSVKALFLLITLPESWDIFCTAISNSAPAGGLTATNVESSLLTEEVNRKNLNNTRGGCSLSCQR